MLQLMKTFLTFNVFSCIHKIQLVKETYMLTLWNADTISWNKLGIDLVIKNMGVDLAEIWKWLHLRGKKGNEVINDLAIR